MNIIQNRIFQQFLIWLMIICGMSGLAKAQDPDKITVSEIALRNNAIKKVDPKFPQAALKAKASGIAVAQIKTSEDGSVLSVTILESPHSSISKAMTEALKQWKFYTFEFKGKPQKIVGKISFYFIIENRKGKVESPF